MTRITTSALLLALLLPGCSFPTYSRITAAWDDDDETASTDSDPSTSDGAGGTWSGPISTVTSATTSSGESEGGTGATDTAGDTDAATSDDADAPPKISDHDLAPATIKVAGAIDVKIWIDGGPGMAEGVRMRLEDGSEVELTLDPDTEAYQGEILALSGFQNADDYVATFTPWRGDLEGESIELPYAIELHAPGEEDLWDLDKSGGNGQVTAISALPEGDVVELLTLVGNGTSKCVLRRRDSEGALLDVVDLIPNVQCKAIDLEIDDDTGELYLLLDGWTNAGWMWWLAKAPSFGATLKPVQYGGVDEVAHALALSAGATMAICGSAPTPEPGDLTDAVVHIVRPDFSGLSKRFDYNKAGQWHKFDEDARDCEFDPNDESRLVVVGSAFGLHDGKNDPKRNRRFNLTYDLETDHGDLQVASVGLVTESVATSVAIDDEGRAWIVGCNSNDVSYEGQMWLLDADGEPGPAVSLGLHSSETLCPAKVRVSPAGYLVVASGGVIGSEPAFSVSAYAPLKAQPLFTFKHEDAGLFHLAHALAIGPYGQIYAGGFGADGFPLFVIIYG